MRILISYDGSRPAEAAVLDLERAGLPPEGEAVVLSVADVWPPGEIPRGIGRAYPRLADLRQRSREAQKKADELSREGAARVSRVLPGWRVTPESTADDPAWGIFKKARAMGADLIVAGSHGRSGLARLALGSVSHKILTHAATSVRIGRLRQRGEGPLRILIGTDGSRGAAQAVEAVLARSWPEGTQVRVMAVTGGRWPAARLAALAPWSRPADEGLDPAMGRLVEDAEGRLTRAGLAASGRVERGDPTEVLVKKAASWRADAVFVGARGLTPWQRPLLGRVSTAVAVHAPCSVEVIKGA